MKRKILTALLSVAIALGLWVYVVTVVSPNSDRHYQNVTVTLQGETLLQDRGLMITSKVIPTVSLHLEGNRTDLDKLNSSNITLTADVSRIYDPGVHSLRFTPSYPGDVASGAINVLSQNPVAIMVEVEERISKEIPVEIVYSGNLPEDFLADKENAVLDHEAVNVTGPKSVVDNIASAQIQVDLNQRVESISETFTYMLCDRDGNPMDVQMVTTDVEAVSLILRIVRVKEISLVVNVVEGGGATGSTTSVTIDPQTIRISGNDNLLEGMESLELGTIELGNMAADEVLTFPIKLPEGVTNETGVSEVTVDVKFLDLATKSLTVKNIKAANVPEGLEVDLITQVLDIQMRGPADKMEALKDTDITVTVDFANAQIGTATVKADIRASVADVGAVGAYQVTATVREKKGNS